MSTNPEPQGALSSELARLSRSCSSLDLCAIAFELLSVAARKAVTDHSAQNGREPVYTTRRGHGPPGLSHRRWRKIAPTIQGAHRVGRWWIVPREAYDDYAASISEVRRRDKPRSGTDGEWSPEQALYDAGILRKPARRAP